jgi:hypothetical protein
MKVANIVSTNKISVSDEFNVVSSLDNIIQGIPTLIVGFDVVNKKFPDFNILSKQLGPNLFWTFKRTEKRDKFEEDLTWFMAYSYQEFVKDLKYVFVDPIQYELFSIKKILKKMNSLKNPVSFSNGRMVYVYGDNYTFGIDLKLMKFVGINPDKIISKIKSKSSVFLDGDKIIIEYKKNVEALGNQVRYIPFLYTIRHEQKDTPSLIHISREN